MTFKNDKTQYSSHEKNIRVEANSATKKKPLEHGDDKRKFGSRAALRVDLT